MKTFEFGADSGLAAERHPAFPGFDYSADMLQRTTPPELWSDRCGYLAAERIARDVRNQNVASLLSRANNALAHVFMGRPRARWSRSR